MTLNEEIQKRLTSIIWKEMTEVIIKIKDDGFSPIDAERIVNQIMNEYNLIPRAKVEIMKT